MLFLSDNFFSNFLQPYKPWGLNFFTLLFFLPTMVFGYLRKCPEVSSGCLLCFITGILYHSTYQRKFMILDQCVITTCLTYFMYFGFTISWYFLGTCFCLVNLIVGYFICSLGHNSVLYHSCLHIISNLGIGLLIQGCFENTCPLYREKLK